MNNDIGFCCLNLAVCIESTSIYMFQKQNFSMLKNSLYKANRKLEDSIKINRPIYNIRMYWTNFWQPIIHIYSQQNIFENTLLKIYSPHLYASFDTFCVQIGQVLEAQWVFEHSEESRNRRHFLRKQRFIDVQAFFKSSLWLE